MNATTMQPASLKSLSARVLQRNHVCNHDATASQNLCNFYPEKTPQKLHRVAPHFQAENSLDLWRWFALEADRVFRSSPKSADSWNRHKEHKNNAQEHCTGGDIPAARVELEHSLTALSGSLPAVQQNLI